ncbi:uncharacterized protein LOC135838476 isoform X3 [Planococcus citri]
MLRRLVSRVHFQLGGSQSLIPRVPVTVFYDVKLSSNVPIPIEDAFLNQVNRVNELTRDLERAKAEILERLETERARLETELVPAQAKLLRAHAELLLTKAELLPDQAELLMAQAESELLPDQAELLRVEAELLPVQVEVLQAEAELLEAQDELKNARAERDAAYMEFIGNNEEIDEDEKQGMTMMLAERSEYFRKYLK